MGKEKLEEGIAVPFADMSAYFGKCSESDYQVKLQRELAEIESRARGRTLTLAGDESTGISSGVIEEWGGRLHFPIRGSGDKASVGGRILSYNPNCFFANAEVALRSKRNRFGLTKKVLLFHDGTGLLLLGDGYGQCIDVLATYDQ